MGREGERARERGGGNGREGGWEERERETCTIRNTHIIRHWVKLDVDAHFILQLNAKYANWNRTYLLNNAFLSFYYIFILHSVKTKVYYFRQIQHSFFYMVPRNRVTQQSLLTQAKEGIMLPP